MLEHRCPLQVVIVHLLSCAIMRYHVLSCAIMPVTASERLTRTVTSAHDPESEVHKNTLWCALMRMDAFSRANHPILQRTKNSVKHRVCRSKIQNFGTAKATTWYSGMYMNTSRGQAQNENGRPVQGSSRLGSFMFWCSMIAPLNTSQPWTVRNVKHDQRKVNESENKSKSDIFLFHIYLLQIGTSTQAWDSFSFTKTLGHWQSRTPFDIFVWNC